MLTLNDRAACLIRALRAEAAKYKSGQPADSPDWNIGVGLEVAAVMLERQLIAVTADSELKVPA